MIYLVDNHIKGRLMCSDIDSPQLKMFEKSRDMWNYRLLCYVIYKKD